VVAEEGTAKDLVSDPLVARAVEAVIDAEVATRNAHAVLSALIEDIQGKRDDSA
jgi:predicted transcriptional regulator